MNKDDPDVWWFDFDPKDFPEPRPIWLEATGYSATVRSIEIKVEYNGVSESVKATAVWAMLTAVAYQNKSTPELYKEEQEVEKDGKKIMIKTWSDMPKPLKDNTDTIGGTGLIPLASFGIKNHIILQFTVLPFGIGEEPGVKFDITRQREGKDWGKNGNLVIESKPVSLIKDQRVETPNDDGTDEEESEKPDAWGRMYCVDFPGEAGQLATHDVVVWRYNFREFVRVRFDNIRPTLNVEVGSRCSDYYDWHVRHNLIKGKNGIWTRSTGDEKQSDQNDIGPGHK